MLNIKEWAEDNLYPDHDDVALTEDERNRAIDLLLSLNVIDNEPTLVITNIRRTDVETLQTGLFLLDSLLKWRHERMIKNNDEPEVTREILDQMSNVRHLYDHLESNKENI